MKRIGPIDNKPDRLFALNDDDSKKDVAPITINDKVFLPQLEKRSNKFEFESLGDNYTGIVANTKNRKDAYSLFKYAAKNSEKEWGYQ